MFDSKKLIKKDVFNNSLTLCQQYNNIRLICLHCFLMIPAQTQERGGALVKRVFAILAAVASGLGMVAAIIAAVISHRKNC